ncbi:RING finger and CHY zinc finger domain-containing protein 1-like isoform X2 [Amphibalanus amphitrite]|uniref:RING finger and CHY zinc finger domain-containing protein 1-like isoform X2 n=1 Tax=Amphibalanus amphitrite TaxID=1232801 RepID=UPI001C922C6A|nr:RING finger and CHY zinc finger domain-containing protein 1-like isoform X2 [Amphibalanus amphitrite]
MVPSLQRLIEVVFELQRRKKESRMEDDQSSDSSVEELPAGGSERYGCKHYRRKARLVAPCCDKVYPCRFCHDEVEDHQLDRKTVREVVCAACGHRQGILQTCTNCDIVLAQYFCAVCRLYDDEDKKQYHCGGCGICRVGGRDLFYHCDICDMCLPNNLRDNHKCVEKASRTNCAVCMEDIHTSRISSHIPPCGHMIHKPCFRMLVDRGYYACPTCNVAMFKMDSVWSKLDQEVAETQMPERYQNCYAKILCNDCQTKSVAPFHIIGLKCGGCGSYNTARGDGPLYKRNAKGELVPFSELDDDDGEPEPVVQPPPAAPAAAPAPADEPADAEEQH